MNWWCWVPYLRAIFSLDRYSAGFAAGPLLTRKVGNPRMVRAIEATTEPESRPPESVAPSGTSLRHISAVVSSRQPVTASAALAKSGNGSAPSNRHDQ